MKKKLISYLIIIGIIFLGIMYIIPKEDDGSEKLLAFAHSSILRNGKGDAVVGHFGTLSNIKSGARTSKAFRDQLDEIFKKYDGTNGNDKINYIIIEFDNGKMFHTTDSNMLTEGVYDYRENNLVRIDDVYLYKNGKYESVDTHTSPNVFK